MPRGLIVSSYGNSRYQVEVANDNALRIEPMIEQINQRLELLEREVDYLKTEMDVADLNIRIAAHNLSLIPLPIKQSDMAAATAP